MTFEEFMAERFPHFKMGEEMGPVNWGWLKGFWLSAAQRGDVGTEAEGALRVIGMGLLGPKIGPGAPDEVVQAFQSHMEQVERWREGVEATERGEYQRCRLYHDLLEIHADTNCAFRRIIKEMRGKQDALIADAVAKAKRG